MKKLLYILVSALFVAFVPSCGKNQGPGEPQKVDPVTPVVPEDEEKPAAATTTLLTLLNEKIAEYGNDASVPTNHVFICAHRANTYEAYLNQIPENSIPNIEMAIAKGADMVELDVRPTKDGVLVLMHDPTVNATTNGKGNLDSFTYEELCKLEMRARGASTYYRVNGQPVRVPTLEEALAACKDKIFVNLDLSNKNCSPAGVVRAIQNTGTVGQVMIYGANGTSEQKEYISKGYERCGDWLAIHPYISKPEDIANFRTGYYDCAKLFQYNYTVYYTPTIDKFGSKCHAQGGLSYSNALDYDSQMRTWYTNYYQKNLTGSCAVLDKFIASGSDFVQTDMCELAHLYLKAKGLR